MQENISFLLKNYSIRHDVSALNENNTGQCLEAFSEEFREFLRGLESSGLAHRRYVGDNREVKKDSQISAWEMGRSRRHSPRKTGKEDDFRFTSGTAGPRIRAGTDDQRAGTRK